MKETLTEAVEEACSLAKFPDELRAGVESSVQARFWAT